MANNGINEDESKPLLSPAADNNEVAVGRLETVGYRVYGQRWYMLFVLSLLTFSNGMIWITFSPITDLTATFYSVDAMSVNWLALVYLVCSVPCGMASSWILDACGLRVGMLLAAWLNFVGASLRATSGVPAMPVAHRYPVAMAGQTMTACAQCFVLFASTKLAALWFKDEQRALANTVASMANPVGIMFANLLSPAICTKPAEMPLLLGLYCIPAGVGALLATFGVCNAVPPSPPTASAAQIHEPFFSGIKKMLRSKPYCILLVSFGSGMAIFTAITTLLEQFLCPWGYSNEFAGLCSALMMGVGVLGAGLAGIFVDKTKKFEEVAKVGVGLTALSAIFFALISSHRNQEPLIALSLGLFGFFGFAIYPVCLELGVECTFPVAEASSSGLLMISGQVQGVAYIMLAQVFTQRLNAEEELYQTCESMHTGSGIRPKDYTYSALGMAGIMAVGSFLLIVFFKCEYKRRQTEQQIAAETILQIAQQQHA